MTKTEELLLELLTKMNKIEAKVEALENKNKTVTTNSKDNVPVFHSDNKPVVEEAVGEAILRNKEKLDPKLDEATDMIIQYFAKVPPKERGA